MIKRSGLGEKNIFFQSFFFTFYFKEKENNTCDYIVVVCTYIYSCYTFFFGSRSRYTLLHTYSFWILFFLIERIPEGVSKVCFFFFTFNFQFLKTLEEEIQIKNNIFSLSFIWNNQIRICKRRKEKWDIFVPFFSNLTNNQFEHHFYRMRQSH